MPPAPVSHFSVECDDVERAKRFYEAVFGWRILPWGPPDYYQIFTGTAEDPGILGDLRQRHAPLSGTGTRGYICTIGVDDLRVTLMAVEAEGGQIVSPPYRIERVGDVATVEDSEGNRVMVMEYVPDLALPEGVRL